MTSHQDSSTPTQPDPSAPAHPGPLPEAVPAGSVVVGVDCSEGSDAALDWAADSAASSNRTLCVVHTELPAPPWYGTGYFGPTVSFGDLHTAVLDAGRACTAAAAERARARHADLDIVEIVDARDPRRGLVEASTKAHLVVLGSRGRGPVATMLLGSVSVAVTRQAHCPVVVVRPGSADDTGKRSEIVALVDGSPDSTGVLEMAYHSASESGLPVRVLHVLWSSWDLADVVLEDAERLLSRTTAGLSEQFPDVEASSEVVSVDGPDPLLALATDAALIVVGHHPSGVMHRLLYHSVSAAVLERAKVPVAVVTSRD